MTQSEQKSDLITVAALGLLAMCLVTVAHEAIGHGGACLLVGGRIRLLTSSVFRCSISSGWIDPSGPFMNLICGLLALILRLSIPARFYRARLFLLLVTALSWFWEGGYLIHAMHQQNGDLYGLARYLLGEVTITQRWVFAALGFALYLSTVRLTSRGLLTLAPTAHQARLMARTAWIAAALGATFAGALGARFGGLGDAILEVGLASFPLLFIPLDGPVSANVSSHTVIARSPFLIAAAILAFAAFAATLGYGLHSSR